MIKKLLNALKPDNKKPKAETKSQIKRAETLKNYLNEGSISELINDFDK